MGNCCGGESSPQSSQNKVEVVEEPIVDDQNDKQEEKHEEEKNEKQKQDDESQKEEEAKQEEQQENAATAGNDTTPQQQQQQQNDVVLPVEMQKQIDDYSAKIREIRESVKKSVGESKIPTNSRDKKSYVQCRSNPSINELQTMIVQGDKEHYHKNVKHVVAGSEQRHTHDICAVVLGSMFFAFAPEPETEPTTEAERDAEETRLSQRCSLCFFLKGAKITELKSSNENKHVVLLESALPSPSDENALQVEFIFDKEFSMTQFEIAIEKASMGDSFETSDECRKGMTRKYGRSVFVNKQ